MSTEGWDDEETFAEKTKLKKDNTINKRVFSMKIPMDNNHDLYIEDRAEAIIDEISDFPDPIDARGLDCRVIGRGTSRENYEFQSYVRSDNSGTTEQLT